MMNRVLKFTNMRFLADRDPNDLFEGGTDLLVMHQSCRDSSFSDSAHAMRRDLLLGVAREQRGLEVRQVRVAHEVRVWQRRYRRRHSGTPVSLAFARAVLLD